MALNHIFLAVFVALIWGFNFIVIKVGVSEIPPLMLGLIRFILVVFPVIFFVPKPVTQWKYIIIFGLFQGFLKFAFLFSAIYLGTSSGIASLGLQTQALFTPLFSLYFFKSRLDAKGIAGMIIAFLGIFLLGYNMHQSATLSGFLLVLCAAASWAFSNIFLKKMGQANMFSVVVWSGLVPILPFALLTFTIEGLHSYIYVWQALSLKGFVCVLYISWIATWIGSTLWGKLTQIYTPNVVAPYSLLIPIVAIFFSWWILDETITPLTLLSCSLVLCGLAINQWSAITNQFKEKKQRLRKISQFSFLQE